MQHYWVAFQLQILFTVSLCYPVSLIKLGNVICCSDMVVVVGGVIPPQDYQFLYDAGAHLIFGPGSRVTEAAMQVVDAIDTNNNTEATG